MILKYILFVVNTPVSKKRSQEKEKANKSKKTETWKGFQYFFQFVRGSKGYKLEIWQKYTEKQLTGSLFRAIQGELVQDHASEL